MSTTTETEAKPDVRFSNCGTIFALTALTPEAKEWIEKNVSSDPWQWSGPTLLIEHGCAADIMAATQNAGLTVEEE